MCIYIYRFENVLLLFHFVNSYVLQFSYAPTILYRKVLESNGFSKSYLNFLQIHLKVFDDTQYSAKDLSLEQQQPQPSTSNTDSDS